MKFENSFEIGKKDKMPGEREKIDESGSLLAGVAPGIFRRGADSSDEGVTLWFLGYYKCQKTPKNLVSPSDGG